MRPRGSTRPHSLPAMITLPAATMIESNHLAMAFGARSRQVIHYWRRYFGFPAFVRDGVQTFSITDHVADWARSYGVEVKRR